MHHFATVGKKTKTKTPDVEVIEILSSSESPGASDGTAKTVPFTDSDASASPEASSTNKIPKNSRALARHSL